MTVFDVSSLEIKKARWPHEILLINLITNHILIFVGLFGLAKSYPLVMLVTPIVSFLVLGYILLRAKQSKAKQDPWFVFCHWQLCAKRSRWFIVMLVILLFIIMGLLASVGWDPHALKPGHYALGGVAILPTMLTVLALVVIESDAMHKAFLGRVPESFIQLYPNNQPKVRDHA